MELCALCTVGVVVIIVIYKCFPKRIVDLSNLGNWAVVTGATDGIGKEFANQLAEKGFNIVLISRTLSKLNDAAKEIEDKYHVSTKVVQADFTSSDEKMYSNINSELETMDVGILVNNVGMTPPHPQYFHDLEQHHNSNFQEMINCNVVSAVNMTRLVLPGMVSRRKGLIINIASVFGQMPSPLLGLYGATKSFITKFSIDLDVEYRCKGVHVHVLNTGLVTTKLSGVRKETIFGPCPRAYVKSALEEVTFRSVCNGYFAHTILYWIYKIGYLISPKIPEYLLLNYMTKRSLKTTNKCSNCSASS